MKRLLTISLMFSLLLSSCCSKEDGQHSEPAAGNGIPIQMNATTTATKGTINTLDDLIGDGFVVWASWTKDTADDSIFSGDYESGTNPAVFGTDGTKVYAEDGNSDGHFTPVATVADKWNYAPTQYWHRGTYTFAAVLPASGFAADFDMNSTAGAAAPPYTATLSVSQTGTTSSPTLTLDFGTSGFNLSTEQTDLMVAFDTGIDGNLLAPVSFSFSHQLALIDIKATPGVSDMTIIGKRMKISGNSSKAADATFTFDASNDSIRSEWGGLEDSTDGNPYYDSSWKANEKPVTGLLVFPQECTMTVSLTYEVTYNNSTYEITKSVDIDCNWQVGKRYEYNLRIMPDSIVFVGVGVASWTANDDITHEFN